jgi:cystathionine gamma-synthase
MKSFRFNMATCAQHDVVAGARSPVSARLRSQTASLPVRAVRFHKNRPTRVVQVNADLQQQQPGAAAPVPRRAQQSATAAAPKAILNAATADEDVQRRQHDDDEQRHPRKPPLMSVGTAAVHGGETGSRARQGVADALTTPIVQTSTYTFKNTAELIAYQEGGFKSFEYGRYGNPTTRAAEEKIMAMEGAEDALLSASGMCSATTMLLSLVPAGGHIVTTTDCYRRTRQFIQTMLPKMGIGCTVIDPSDLKALARALEQHKVSLFFSESPTNPYLRCVDVPAVSKLCRAAGAVVCIDSTFATPCNQRALALGADLVIHSATK